MYLKLFANYKAAFNFMVDINLTFRAANNYKNTFCVVAHPDNNMPYAVVDLGTAIELGSGYVFSDNRQLIPNPFV